MYSSLVFIRKDVALDSILETVAEWLSRKHKTSIHAKSLGSDGDWNLPDGAVIRTLTVSDEYPVLASVQYKHRDRKVPGRDWITEIGIRKDSPDSDSVVTIMLYTREISVRVNAAVSPTRPVFVKELASQYASVNTAGLMVQTLDEKSADMFIHVVLDEERIYPLVVVSPNSSGGYIVEPENFLALVAGLAEVVVIPVGADTFRIAKVLGSNYVPWGGAINIIFPIVKGRSELIVPTRKILPNELEDIEYGGSSAAVELLSILTHRMNVLFSLRHLSPSQVKESKVKRELERRRQESTLSGDSREYIQLLEETLIEKESIIKQLGTDLEELELGSLELEDAVKLAEDEKRQIEYENSSLKLALSSAGARADSLPEAELSDFRAAVFCLTHDEMTLENCLVMLRVLFPDRIIVLPSAIQSARDARVFIHTKKAFELLWTLATEYWECMVSGNGDSQARKVFGANSYAATESESVRNNNRARELRTFIYRGEEVEMLRHLKIGIKESATETLRVHFEWDSERRMIVIGHCGQHLDHR